METRSIAIGLIAIVAAFAAAFGLAKSGGSKTETAGAGVKVQSIKVASPAAVAGVEVGGTVPALKAERKAPAKKKEKPASSSNTSTPSTTQHDDARDEHAVDEQHRADAEHHDADAEQRRSPAQAAEQSKPSRDPASGGGEDG